MVRKKLPQATLTIVGKNPPKDFLNLAADKDSGIVAPGFVPELDPYFARSAVTVVPVRAGGGMRVRILEAFARAAPVVTTTVGLEGIDASPGEDVLVADSPEEFAASVIALIEQKDLRQQLSNNGRRLVERKYDWQVVLGRLDEIYSGLTRNGKP